jgi:hypothetical protein
VGVQAFASLESGTSRLFAAIDARMSSRDASVPSSLLGILSHPGCSGPQPLEAAARAWVQNLTNAKTRFFGTSVGDGARPPMSLGQVRLQNTALKMNDMFFPTVLSITTSGKSLTACSVMSVGHWYTYVA